jgi:hypothetical protein
MSVQINLKRLREQMKGGLQVAERAVIVAGRDTIRQMARTPTDKAARLKILARLGLVARNDACACGNPVVYPVVFICSTCSMCFTALIAFLHDRSLELCRRRGGDRAIACLIVRIHIRIRICICIRIRELELELELQWQCHRPRRRARLCSGPEATARCAARSLLRSVKNHRGMSTAMISQQSFD